MIHMTRGPPERSHYRQTPTARRASVGPFLFLFSNGDTHLKKGRPFDDLMTEVKRQAEAKHDYLANTGGIRIVQEGDRMRLVMGKGKEQQKLEIGETAHNQIAKQTDIPRQYYHRMLAERPELLAQNVNTWFSHRPEVRMVRTLDGKARAMLSDKYRPLDNDELLQAAEPALNAAGLQIVSCEVTEKRLFLKAVHKKIRRHLPAGHMIGDGSHVSFKVPSGDVVPAIQIANSEIGYRALSVTGGILDQGCTNLMWMFHQRGLRKFHLGGRLEIGDELYRMLSDQTKRTTDAAVWMQFRDAVKAAITEDGFDDLIETLKEAHSEEIKGDPTKVVEVTAKKFGLSDKQRIETLQHLIRGGDLSKLGLANAVTSTANSQTDYDDASDLEALGGEIIELPKRDWAEIAKAA